MSRLFLSILLLVCLVAVFAKPTGKGGKRRGPRPRPAPGRAEQGVKGIFKHLDQDGDGRMSFDELQNFTSRIAPDMSETFCRELFDMADVDSDGEVTYEEFLEKHKDLEQKMKSAHVEHMFKKMDLDSDGELTKSESRTFFKSVKMPVANVTQIVFDIADVDGDGSVTFEELMENKDEIEHAIHDAVREHRDRRQLKERHGRHFREMDSNGDGFVSFAEVKNITEMHFADVPEEFCQQIFDTADENGDGKITLKEYSTSHNDVAEMIGKYHMKQMLKEHFHKMDKNGDNVVDVDEAMANLKEDGLPEEICKEVFALNDADHDGGVTLDEFVNGHQETMKLLWEHHRSSGRDHNGRHRPGGGLESKIAKEIQAMDTDGDGRVTYEEASAAFANEEDIPEELGKRMFEIADVNGDGAMTVEEAVSTHKQVMQVVINYHLNGGLNVTSEELKEQLTEEFEEIDSDDDGSIDLDEALSSLLAEGEIPEELAQKIFEICDQNGDRGVTLEEFVDSHKDVVQLLMKFYMKQAARHYEGEGRGKYKPEDFEREFERGFKEMDTDGDGSITFEEAAAHHSKDDKIPEELGEKLFAASDENGDGGVTLEEAKRTHQKVVEMVLVHHITQGKTGAELDEKRRNDFKGMDKHYGEDNGKLEMEALVKAMKTHGRVPDELSRNVFRTADQNSDGFVTEQEYVDSGEACTNVMRDYFMEKYNLKIREKEDKV